MLASSWGDNCCRLRAEPRSNPKVSLGFHPCPLCMNNAAMHATVNHSFCLQMCGDPMWIEGKSFGVSTGLLARTTVIGSLE